MDEKPTILDYQTPPRSIGGRVADLIAAGITYAGWFAFKRPLRSSEVFIVGWSITCATWAARCAFRSLMYEYEPVTAETPIVGAIAVVAIAALARLVLTLQIRAVLLSLAVALPTGVAAGLLQYDRCPHASYVQILGVSIPVSGKACGNVHRITPWWMR